MRCFTSLFLLLLSSFCALAQQTQPTPSLEDRVNQRIIDQQRNNQAHEKSATSQSDGRSPGKDDLLDFRRASAATSRKLTREEALKVQVDAALRQRYASFLTTKNAGLTKLIADQGCDQPYLVSASSACLEYTMPGAGNAFSFRAGNYSIRGVADIALRRDKFFAPGVRIHGIIIDAGDIPIESLDMTHPAIKTLRSFHRSSTTAEFERSLRELTGAVPSPEPHLSSIGNVITGHAYLLRSIAYAPGTDPRGDVIVAFKVLEFPEDGSTTIVWHILSSQGAPVIKR